MKVTGDGNDKLCSCGHLLEDHEEAIDLACTAPGCECLSYTEAAEGEKP